MTKYVFILALLALVAPLKSHACGGGQSVVLNDDTIMVAQGFVFPLSEPEKDLAFDAEAFAIEFNQCQEAAIDSGSFAAILSGRACNNTLEMFDSKGVRTHLIDVSLAGTKITYYVNDVINDKSDVYSAQLHTRSACGLQKLEE